MRRGVKSGSLGAESWERGQLMHDLVSSSNIISNTRGETRHHCPPPLLWCHRCHPSHVFDVTLVLQRWSFTLLVRYPVQRVSMVVSFFLFQLNYSHLPQTGGNRHPLAQLHSIGHKVMLLPWMLKLKKLEMDLGRRAGCVFGGRCWFKKCLWLEVVVRVEVFPQQCNVAIRLRAASHHHHTTFSPPQQHHHYYYFYKYYYSYPSARRPLTPLAGQKGGNRGLAGRWFCDASN